jgi:hypothetical protein
MFLTEKETGHLVEVMDLSALFDPFIGEVKGRYNLGEDLPEPEMFAKSKLTFNSGEALPRCWTDPHYRDQTTAVA